MSSSSDDFNECVDKKGCSKSGELSSRTDPVYEVVGKKGCSNLGYYTAESSTPTPQKIRRANRAKASGKRDLYDEDSGEDDTNNSPEISVSCVAIKERIMGNPLDMNYTDFGPKGDMEASKSKSYKDWDIETDRSDYSLPLASEGGNVNKMENVNRDLSNELSCVICHQIIYQPTSLMCGHSFCIACIKSWFNDKECQPGKAPCPRCGQVVLMGTTLLAISRALAVSIKALFPHETRAREQRDKVHKNALLYGAHIPTMKNDLCQNEYSVLSSLEDNLWVQSGGQTSNGGVIRTRRSIVMDDQDQTMQLSLALCRVNNFTPVLRWVEANSIEISLCLLTMEEDEVEDSGFPLLVGQQANRHLLATEERFHGEIYMLLRRRTTDAWQELVMAKESLGVEGTVRFQVTLDTTELREATQFSFQHQETGLELQVSVAEINEAPAGPIGFLLKSDKEERPCANDSVSADGILGCEDDTILDRFEDDSFIVQSDGSTMEEIHDDVCCLCGNGGNMIVCDGGRNHAGCGCYFHVVCVKREIIPPGDWICRGCANGIGLKAGVEGYEFVTDSNMESILVAGKDVGKEDIICNLGGGRMGKHTSVVKQVKRPRHGHTSSGKVKLFIERVGSRKMGKRLTKVKESLLLAKGMDGRLVRVEKTTAMAKGGAELSDSSEPWSPTLPNKPVMPGNQKEEETVSSDEEILKGIKNTRGHRHKCLFDSDDE